MAGMILKICLLAFVLSFQDCNSRPKPSAGKNENINVRQTPVAVNNKQPANTRQGKTKMENTEEKNIPALEVSLNQQDKVLSLEYKVKNTTGKTIYLFNVLYEWDDKGEPIPAPQGVYASLNEDSLLHLAKEILPVPSIKSVEVRIIPYVTKVEAGAEYREKVDLKIPIEEYNTYFPKQADSKTEPAAAKSVYFTIQFIRQSDELEVEPTNLKNAFSVWHPNLFGNVETLRSNDKPIAVRVNKRTDEFEEF
jgi:hypothetical protein